MKNIGLIITAIIIALTGNYLAVRTEKRIKTLEKCLLMIKSIKAQISFSRVPVNKIIDNLITEKELKSLRFLKSVKNQLNTGASFYSAWKNSVEGFVGECGFSGEDAQVITGFAEQLGGTDVKNQLENCDTYAEILLLKIENLKAKSQSKIKIYNSLGILAGALVVIIFI